MKPKSPTYSANMAAKEGDVESRCQMKHLLLTTIAAVLLVGCGPSIDIWEAAANGNIGAVKKHLAAGTDVSERDEYESTPLHYAPTPKPQNPSANTAARQLKN